MTGNILARFVVTAVAVVMWSCAVNPATGERQLSLISESQEIQMGLEADQSLVASMGLYDDADLQAYVESVGKRLAAVSERPNLPWEFRLMDDPVVNAFALPGGYTYITRGILAYLQSEAQLAEILGHEIGHVTARHSVEQISRAQLAQVGLVAGVVFAPDLADFAGAAQAGLGLLFLKFGRDDERQSDDLGLRYMLRAGYDPRPAPDVFRMLDAVSSSQGGSRTPEWLATHPNPANRAERLEEQIAALPENLDGRIVGVERYHQAIDDLIYGVNPREGFFRDNLFLHPDLRFQIRFPTGWQTVNQKSAVLAGNQQQNAIVQLGLAAGAASAIDAARTFFSQDGVRGAAERRAAVNGLPAAGGAFTAQTQNAQLGGDALFIEYGGAVYQILAYGTAEGWAANRDVMVAAQRSFDRLTDRDALDVRPNRIDVVTLDRAMTLAEFADRHPSVVGLDELSLLNQRPVDARIPAGTVVKRVVRG